MKLSWKGIKCVEIIPIKP